MVLVGAGTAPKELVDVECDSVDVGVRLALMPVKNRIFGGMSSLVCVPLTLISFERKYFCGAKCN